MKKFKTIVINGKKAGLAVLSAAIAGACAAVIYFSFSRTSAKIASSGEFSEAIISMQLHNESGKISPRRILGKIFGCDAKSIIANQVPALSEELLPSPSPSPSPEVPESSPPPAAEAKPVAEAQAKSDMTISNRTSIDVDPNALADGELSFSLTKSETPQILIFHTHTTESYSDDKSALDNSDRNLDETKNIVAVGEAMARIFAQSGVGAIHDKTVHDYPSFNGAYTRSLATVKANLAKYPDIKLVLDIHRDGIVREDGTRVKVAADINGEKTAQCMFVIGSNANLTHDNWLENMKLACKLQRLANETYPGLMRPIILREERFNQQVSAGAVIIEIGSNGNTLDEAIRGGEYAAKTILKLFGI